MKIQLLPKMLKDVWDDWGIELLIAVSCGMHMVLTLFGSSRRRMQARKVSLRFIMWSAYLLSTYVATVIIGKLTVIPVSDYEEEVTDSELRGFIAPLLLVQLGSHDAITAYSIEDNRLGVRQIVSLIAQSSSVVWILLRCWTYSAISYLYLPLALAGFIKYGETTWALSTALTGKSGVTISELRQDPKYLSEIFKNVGDDPDLELILRAYCRFYFVKPHIDRWLYKPLYESNLKWYSIDEHHKNPEDMFRITDLELGFIYDVLYTKAPIIYTWTGFVFRLVSTLCLVSSSVVFACLFRDSFVFYINAGVIFVVLGVIITLEAYQIYMLFLSDWAIITLIEHRNKPGVKRLLNALVRRSRKWKRWSNTMGQFNLIRYCLDYDRLRCGRFLKFKGLDIEIRKYFCTNSVGIPSALKEMMIDEMAKLNNKKQEVKRLKKEKKKSSYIGRIGEFALNIHNIILPESAESFNWCVGAVADFDKSIVVWHLATEICYHSETGKQHPHPKTEMGRILSNYMMYLLIMRSDMLSITTSDIVFLHASQQLRVVLKTGKYTLIRDEKTACEELKTRNLAVGPESAETEPTMVTKDWDVLGDAKMLSEKLSQNENAWDLICSVWMDMLCFAATNCGTNRHLLHLRRGGEIVTHIWLLQRHNRDEEHPSSKDKSLMGDTNRA
ncbi:hypothetical protein FEM48_Zijuj01G0164500 [Ziziphus jujuba var. spinosa]|uniref:DUF4220 domain-containing protein n=1 Tax=Ziziphus jujuba var. spinosa TaxID=714518 RepID=A0A978W2B3_ZIZJJ|nr:hypothetical protein FEM48_Zijuj01G0164500 [Ziziphus jujuba var. spinosa]